MVKPPSNRFAAAFAPRPMWLESTRRGAARSRAPVAVAAVILDPRRVPRGIDDSKKLTPEHREALFEEIIARRAPPRSCSPRSPRSRRQHPRRHARRHVPCRRGLSRSCRRAVIDGIDVPPGLTCPGLAIIDGDASHASVAAASILAKVTRDRAMSRSDCSVPDYGFGHKGYSTPEHLAALTGTGRAPITACRFAPLAPRAPAARIRLKVSSTLSLTRVDFSPLDHVLRSVSAFASGVMRQKRSLRPDEAASRSIRSSSAIASRSWRAAAGSVDLVFADPPYNLQLAGDLTRPDKSRSMRSTTTGTSSTASRPTTPSPAPGCRLPPRAEARRRALGDRLLPQHLPRRRGAAGSRLLDAQRRHLAQGQPDAEFPRHAASPTRTRR